MFDAIKKYAVFSGRARRKEYWLFILLYFILIIVGSFIDGFMGMYDPVSGYGPISAIVTLGLLIPSIAVLVRRLHDIDKSGWWALLSLVPIANLVILVFMFFNGTVGENRFGPDPKAVEQTETS